VPQNLRSFQEALEQAGFVVPYATLQLDSGLDDDRLTSPLPDGAVDGVSAM
jgi:hypothetical protein